MSGRIDLDVVLTIILALDNWKHELLLNWEHGIVVITFKMSLSPSGYGKRVASFHYLSKLEDDFR